MGLVAPTESSSPSEEYIRRIEESSSPSFNEQFGILRFVMPESGGIGPIRSRHKPA